MSRDSELAGLPIQARHGRDRPDQRRHGQNAPGQNRHGQDRHGQLIEVATQALRWVADSAVAADGGLTWPETREPGARVTDDLYDGTAGVLVAFAEARLAGVTAFDSFAGPAAARLIRRTGSDLDAWSLAAGRGAGYEQAPDPSLYTGLAGMLAALDIWAQASGDQAAKDAARAGAVRLARICEQVRPVTQWRDLIGGEAGVLLALAALGGPAAAPGASAVAASLAGAAEWIDGLPEWRARADETTFYPNLSHGLAGIGLALAAASGPLGQPRLLEIASLAGRRLVQLGCRPDGTLAVPHSIPLSDPLAPVSFGWCHGPVGTVRLFQALDAAQPGHGWDGWAEAGRQAVRRSGLPVRRYPGFWDNIGQCCGTAGVGEMALDAYQRDPARTRWLDWADELADDVLGRRIADSAGTRWSHTDFRGIPPLLEPATGWMQGAAGIAGWLLRLARVRRDGAGAARLAWPDQPRPSSRA